jgi:HSP20 family molecular chaperone IbpA
MLAGTTKRDLDIQLTNNTIKAGIRGKAPNVEVRHLCVIFN